MNPSLPCRAARLVARNMNGAHETSVLRRSMRTPNSTPLRPCGDSLACLKRCTVVIPSNLFREAGVNFVFGTTGGDRDALMKVTEQSGVYAVIVSQLATKDSQTPKTNLIVIIILIIVVVIEIVIIILVANNSN